MPKTIDADAPDPSDRAPEGAVTASDLTADQATGGGAGGREQMAGTASDQRAQETSEQGETSNSDIEMPPAGDPEPAPGVVALGDPKAKPGTDTNTLTAKNAPLDTGATGAGSKDERPLELPANDKADLAERRQDRADERASRSSETSRGSSTRSTDTEEANDPLAASDRPERRGAIDTNYAGPERRRTVDSTHGVAAGRPVARRGGKHGSLVLDLHGRKILPGSTHTATYEFERDADVADGAGETSLVLEMETPRGRRLIPVVRTGQRGVVSVTFPVEFEGPYRLRLLDGSDVLATSEDTV